MLAVLSKMVPMKKKHSYEWKDLYADEYSFEGCRTKCEDFKNGNHFMSFLHSVWALGEY